MSSTDTGIGNDSAAGDRTNPHKSNSSSRITGDAHQHLRCRCQGMFTSRSSMHCAALLVLLPCCLLSNSSDSRGEAKRSTVKDSQKDKVAVQHTVNLPSNVSSQYSTFKHLRGQWVFEKRFKDVNQTIPAENHRCCAAASVSKKCLPNDAKEFYPASLVPRVNHAIPNGWLPLQIASHCSCQNKDVPKAGQAVGEWVWQPTHSNQTKPEWNSTEFCKALGNGKVYFVGDSLSLQAWYAVVSLLSQDNAGCQNQVLRYMSDLLAPIEFLTQGRVEPAVRGAKLVERGESLTQVAKRIGLFNTTFEPRTVVIGAGAHFNHMPDFMRAWEWLRLFFIKNTPLFRKNGVRIIWRTLHKPHPGCNKAKRPSKTNHVNKETKWKAWQYVEEYDRMSVAMLRTLPPEMQPTLMDMTPSYLRPDGHTTGCGWHFCVHPKTGNALSHVAHALLEALLFPNKLHV